MTTFRLVLYLSSLFIFLAGPALTADKGGKRLYLPWPDYGCGPQSPEAQGDKLRLYLSVPVQALAIDYKAFVAKKDKTPAEKFIAEVFAAAADGTAKERYFDGKEDFFFSELVNPQAKERLFTGLRLEYLAKADGEHILLYCCGESDESRRFYSLHFRQDKDGRWAVAIDAKEFCMLLADGLTAAVQRGERDALFVKPDTKFATGVNFNKEKWVAGVMTPDSDFKVHFDARPLSLDFKGRGAPRKNVALAAAMYGQWQSNSNDQRYSLPVLAVDAGALAWVIYEDRVLANTDDPPRFYNLVFRKNPDGSYMPCPTNPHWEMAFDLIAINVLNASCPMLK